MRRSVILLAGGVAIAGAAVLVAGSGGTAAEIQGAALDSAGTPGATAQAQLVPPPPPPPPAVDLGKLALTGDHYESAGRRLTLDPELQAAAEKLLAETKTPRAAIVAMTPDGRILAIVGRRTADPTGKGDATDDPQLAVELWAPAASVFKLVTASALVQAGVDPDDKIMFHGGVRSVLESNLRDDRRDNNQQSLLWAVAHSNNAILGKLAFQHLDPAQLGSQMHALGLDAPMLAAPLGGLQLVPGKLTLPADKDLSFARTAAGFSAWATSTDSKPTDSKPTDSAAATGTWGSQLSALGGALLAATFADDGEQPTPYLVDGSAALARHRVLSTDTARKVGRMMQGACEFGSASRSFRHSKVAVAGKTGTLTQESPNYMQFSWFVGYAPVDKPEIVIAVVLGNPENWQMKGHEVGQKLITAFLHKRPPS
nr:penicillin-binding transpeptidase domain-containing protein [Kofleriaceae bacterium]